MARDFTPFDVFQGPPDNVDACVRGYSAMIPVPFGPAAEDSFAARVRTWFRKEVNTLVRVPKAFLEERRSEIIRDPKLRGASEFPDICDVLFAWWLKHNYSQRPRNDATPVLAHIPVDLRPMPIFKDESAPT
ncbi:hypothetical protein FB45DRAFT_38482 [Roridomyces roridus]|uniref:Uncharacterized protein n=1 Tax=Roridomyces roridus TaxID=1738132 RepID=A0AAD7FM91_9AGAR|nr:hypothetical protein FB45DRAFT_38482 [Roridomyces roridus]